MSHVRARVGTIVVTVAMLVGVVGLASPAAAADGSPRGNLERVAGVAGAIELSGWAFDPDTASSIYVWVTVDGVGRHVYANKERADVAAAFPGQGSEHGFASSIPASGGTHTVCATASNVGTGAHTPLGCRTVAVTGASSSWGSLDVVTPAEGGIQVAGWAIDGDTAASVYVWMTVDGVGRHLYASLARPDVAAVFPAYGENHGFSGRLAAGAGAHQVCATISNVGPGTHTALGCRTVTVAPVEQVLGVSTSSTPAPTASPTPTPTPTTAPAPGSRPNADNTGVPAGTSLRVHNGNLTITAAGTVVDGLDVQGTIIVKADNVTIRNTRVRGVTSNTYTTPLINQKNGNRNLVVQDSELIPSNPSVVHYGIIGWNFTLDRVEIAKVVDGVHIIGSNTIVRSSYIHDIRDYVVNGSTTHSDGIQIQVGSNHRVTNNRIEGGYNSAIQVTQDRGDTSDLQITGNWMSNGLCSVNIAEKGLGPIAGLNVSTNTFGRGQRSQDCAIVRPTTTTVTATGNYFEDGEVVKLRNA